jgi:hypothetical protein
VGEGYQLAVQLRSHHRRQRRGRPCRRGAAAGAGRPAWADQGPGLGQQGARRRHPDAAVLRDLAVLLADGGDCLSDLAVLRDQPELFGPVASTPTAWRVVERLAQDPDGLAGLRLARAHARGRAWAAGGDPEVGGGAASHRRRRDLGAGPQRPQGRRGRDLQAQLRVRPAAGLPGPRPSPRRAPGRPATARQRRPRRRR